MNEQEQLELYEKAIKIYGPSAQIRMFVEECAEAIAAIMQYYERGRGNLNKVAEELADVEITLDQLKLIVNNEAKWDMVGVFKQLKLDRLNQRLKGE